MSTIKMKKQQIYLLPILLFFIGLNIQAQEQQISSLLSNFGLGTKFSESTIAQRAQGDLAVIGNNNREVISIANPALLSELRLTSFSISLQSLGAKVETTNTSFNSASLALSNVSLGFPIGKNGAFALGLRADAAVGYELDTEDFYNNANGSINQIYASLGHKIYKGLSLGVQLNQYFGKTNKLRADQSVQQSRVYNYNYNVSATSLKLGLQYQYNLKNNIEAKLGAYTVLGYDVNASGNFETYLAVDNSNNFIQIENTVQQSSIEGTEVNAAKSVLGVGLGSYQKWFVGASYEKQNAVSYSGNVFQETIDASTNGTILVNYEDRSKISIGGYYIPKKNALKNYFNRVVYRSGFKYEKTGLKLNSNSVINKGLSIGLGLPIGKRISYINVSGEFGKLGDVEDNNYEERYFNVGVNFTLSDKWFKKRVIN